MKNCEQNESNKINENKKEIKLSKSLSSLSFMKKDKIHEINSSSSRRRCTNEDQTWVAKDFENEYANLKKILDNNNKQCIILNCLGRRSYQNYNENVDIYNVELKNFISALKKKKPINTLSL